MPLSRRHFLKMPLITSLAAPFYLPQRTQALETVRFGLNWLPQPEMGGFFEAKAKGFYEQEGLDLVFVPGGPQVNNRLALINEALEFYLGGNLFQAFAAQENNVPTVVIGAFFKKDPQILMMHPQKTKNIIQLHQLRERPIYISKIGLITFFPWLKAEFGFSEAFVKPYLFNTQGFLADPLSLCQGYISSEPFAIEQATGLKVHTFLLDDYGLKTPSNLVEVKRTLPQDLRKRFMRASQKGWDSYVRDGAAGNQLIQSLNPEITPTKIAAAKAMLSAHDFYHNGSISPQVIADFYQTMLKANALKPGLDPDKIYEAV